MTADPTARFEMPDANSGGHASIDMFLHQEKDFRVALRTLEGSPMVCLRLGTLSLVVTPGQWRAIADAVEAVLP
jgi:hypothetical protein